DLVEVLGRGDPRRRPDRALERERRIFGLLDPGRLLDHPHLCELCAERLEVPAARKVAGELVHRHDRRSVADVGAPHDRRALGVEHEPPSALEGDQVDPPAALRLGREDAGHRPVLGGGCRDPLQFVGEGHRVKRMDAATLFAPLGPTYDRWAAILSFGQDPRWRRFLVSRVEAGPADTVLDVQTGPAAVALELVRQKDCYVVGIDQSAEMLDEGRRRVALAAATRKVRLQQGDARSLPFDDGQFDALTFTYLLRYVGDPAATLHELARVVK